MTPHYLAMAVLDIIAATALILVVATVVLAADRYFRKTG